MPSYFEYRRRADVHFSFLHDKNMHKLHDHFLYVTKCMRKDTASNSKKVNRLEDKVYHGLGYKSGSRFNKQRATYQGMPYSNYFMPPKKLEILIN